MKINMDIDIDVANREDILAKLPHIPASAIRKTGIIEKHNSGVYFQQIPQDPDTGYSSIDFNDAEEIGYMKFDFLNNTIYKGIKNPEHLDRLVNTEPSWSLLEESDIVKLLHHIHNYAALVKVFKPTSIDELAALIALIRPAKKYLRDKTKKEIMEKIWDNTDDGGYSFKKSHSYAYALSIIVQLNLIVEELTDAL